MMTLMTKNDNKFFLDAILTILTVVIFYFVKGKYASKHELLPTLFVSFDLGI